MMEGWPHVFRRQLQAQSTVAPLAAQDPQVPFPGKQSPHPASDPHRHLQLRPALLRGDDG